MVDAPLPPGPRGHWITGNLPEFRQGRLDFLTRCAREHGDVVALRFGPRRVYLVVHPDAIEEVLATHSRHFIKHFALRLNPRVLGKGLLTSEGDFWLRQRRLIQPAFVRRRISAYGPDMVACTERVLAGWQAGETRDVLTEMMRLTLAIAAKTLFDAEADDDASAVGTALRVLQENFLIRFSSLLPVPMWLPTPTNLRLRRAVRRLDEIIYRFIRRRRQGGKEGSDLLSILLHARDEEDKSGMTDRQLRDEAMTLFLAGHETTALTLSWAWHLLATHPEAEERLAAEVRQVLGGRPPAVGDLPRLKYAEGVVLEALRLYPPAYTIGREALAECVIGGYRVPRGTTILMSQWVVQRDPRWFDKPAAFRPERWAGDLAQRLPRYAYFPFGGGPRLCIGNTFAMMETVLVLATITPRFRFTAVPSHPVVPWPTFTLRPRYGIPAVVTPR
jgi:cytochrome P450